MSTSGEIVLPFGDGEYNFALRGRQLEHLETVIGLPIGQIAARLFSRMPAYKDIRETIHQGLIGGGMAQADANKMMKLYFDGVPIAPKNDEHSLMNIAVLVMAAAWFGVDKLESSQSGEARAGESPASSTSPVTEPHSSSPA